MDVDRAALIAAVIGEGRGDLDLSGATVMSGWESDVLDSGDGWIYRFPRPHVAFERELAILHRLRHRLPAPIPVVEWTGQHTTFAAYRRLDGCEFDDDVYEGASAGQRDVLAASLAEFLVAMHSALTTAEIAELGIPAPADPFEPIATIRTRIASVPASARSVVDDVLAEAESRARQPDGDQPVVMHNDFDFSNMVLDGPIGRVAACGTSHVCSSDRDPRICAISPVDPLTSWHGSARCTSGCVGSRSIYAPPSSPTASSASAIRSMADRRISGRWCRTGYGERESEYASPDLEPDHGVSKSVGGESHPMRPFRFQ